ncbi:hypothetical protein FI667_g15493, partial [Globisporangium splendens]
MAEEKDAEQPGELEVEYLQDCYNAVLLRRVERGRESIRTRQGYELLRSKYQPRLRFLHEAGTENADASAVVEYEDQDSFATTTPKDPIAGRIEHTEMPGDKVDAGTSDGDDDNDRKVLEKRSKRTLTRKSSGSFRIFAGRWSILEDWGTQMLKSTTEKMYVPEWKELEQSKYYSFTFHIMLWLFPGIPEFEAQEQTGRDWKKDCEFEAPAELQLSTSAKFLIRERDSRTSVRRKTIALKSHFMELEKQFLWTFRDLGDRPSLLLIPNHSISRRTLTFFDTSSSTDFDAFFSTTQEPFLLQYGADNSLYGRIDHQSTRLFIVDHRERTNAFAVTPKTSLIQNTTSGGGAGAAAVIAALTTPPASTASTNGLAGGGDTESATAHSFIFVVKQPEEIHPKASVRVQKLNATLSKQWYTTLSSSGGARESLASLSGNKEEPAKLTSEDYVTTAEYIEALMKEVSDEESKLLAGVEWSDMRVAQTTRDADEMKASWDFAQYRSQSRATSERTSASRKAEGQQILGYVEPIRRGEWMNYGYIQRLSASEKQAHQNQHQTNPLRSPCVPKEVAIGDDELSDEQEKKHKSDQQCPGKYATMNLRPPSSGRPRTASISLASGCSTTSQSATLSYINRRKIHSAASARVYEAIGTHRESSSPIATPSEKCKSSSRFDFDESVPIGSLNTISDLILNSVDSAFTKHIEAPRITSNGSETSPKEAEVTQNCSTGTPQMTTTNANLSTVDAQQLRAEKIDAILHESPTKKVTTKKKRRSRRAQDHARKRFDLQVQELVSISAALKRHSESERKATATVDYSFLSPRRVTQPSVFGGSCATFTTSSKRHVNSACDVRSEIAACTPGDQFDVDDCKPTVANSLVLLLLKSHEFCDALRTLEEVDHMKHVVIQIHRFRLDGADILAFPSTNIVLFMVKKVYLKKTRVHSTFAGFYTIPYVVLKARLRFSHSKGTPRAQRRQVFSRLLRDMNIAPEVQLLAAATLPLAKIDPSHTLCHSGREYFQRITELEKTLFPGFFLCSSRQLSMELKTKESQPDGFVPSSSNITTLGSVVGLMFTCLSCGSFATHFQTDLLHALWYNFDFVCAFIQGIFEKAHGQLDELRGHYSSPRDYALATANWWDEAKIALRIRYLEAKKSYFARLNQGYKKKIQRLQRRLSGSEEQMLDHSGGAVSDHNVELSQEFLTTATSIRRAIAECKSKWQASKRDRIFREHMHHERKTSKSFYKRISTKFLDNTTFTLGGTATYGPMRSRELADDMGDG